jgi:hypothetical protein
VTGRSVREREEEEESNRPLPLETRVDKEEGPEHMERMREVSKGKHKTLMASETKWCRRNTQCTLKRRRSLFSEPWKDVEEIENENTDRIR